jgi:zinc/manganese transport system ATP-binding protein
MTSGAVGPVLEIEGGALGFGDRTLWRDLDLRIRPGEFLAVLGPNGSGKTSLLRTILGMQQMDAGSARLLGDPIRGGDRRIGYVPQQKILPVGTPLRGRDLVALGVDGHRFGLPVSRAADRARVAELIAAVGADGYADRPIGRLSGGEQQRLRVLDLHNQRGVAELIDRRRREHATAVVFVTHDVNPVLGLVDRVLYLANGRFREGAPDEVLRSDVLSDLYGTPVDVIRTGGRIVVVGGLEHAHHEEVGA